MTEREVALVVRRAAFAVLLGLWAGGVAACELAGREPAGAERRPLGEGVPALSPRGSWQRLSLDPARAVTPRWSPSGERLLVRGDLGIGLYVLSLRGGELLHTEEGYRGDALFTPAGDLCRGPREEARAVRIVGPGQRGAEREARCELYHWDERFGERLHDGASAAVYHDAYEGTVTRVSSGGAVDLITDDGVWNVAVSPTGRRIAWARGTLSEPELFVHDGATGARSLGRGAHPAWSPSGRFLLFTRPTVTDGPSGAPDYDADLFVFDADAATVVRLTDTPGVAEMQPRVAPRGDRVAFADWQGGVVYVAEAVGLSGRGGAR